MSIPYIQVERKHKTLLLTLNRPENKNTLTRKLLEELNEKLQKIKNDDSIRILIITGAGKNFGLGADWNDLGNMLTLPQDEARRYFQIRIKLLEKIILALMSLPQIVIAAVNGQAAGASFSLALACDLRIVSNQTKFNFAYGSLGLSTDGGMTWFLPQIVGTANARALLINQKVIRSTEALQLGIAVKAVATSELITHAMLLAEELTHTAKYSVYCTKQMLNLFNGGSVGLARHLAAEHALFEQGLFSPEFAQKMLEHSKY
jgi:Enoyl-CoA hydratase/carnithine racemase